MADGLLAPVPELKATPRKHKLLGLLADALTSANDYAQRPNPVMPGGKANPVLGLLADVSGLGSLATTAQRASYGEPLTNGLRGSKAFLKPETADVAMMAPLSPRNALAALGMVGGMADNGAMRAATVWHGSPHKFDKFDASKIGTGEGAQAYGHGLYFAENPKVAQGYANALEKASKVKAGKQDIAAAMKREANKLGINYMDAADYISAAKNALFLAKGDKEQAIARLSDPSFLMRGKQRAGAIDLLTRVNKETSIEEGKHLYKVDLPDDAIAKMLDWDKPLSQQHPDLQMLGRDSGVDKSATGAALYQALVMQARDAAIARGNNAATTMGASQAAASNDLRGFGIPGIRYLDGGSRGAGNGTSNFVVFPGNENLLTILERNGQPFR